MAAVGLRWKHQDFDQLCPKISSDIACVIHYAIITMKNKYHFYGLCLTLLFFKGLIDCWGIWNSLHSMSPCVYRPQVPACTLQQSINTRGEIWNIFNDTSVSSTHDSQVTRSRNAKVENSSSFYLTHCWHKPVLYSVDWWPASFPSYERGTAMDLKSQFYQNL